LNKRGELISEQGTSICEGEEELKRIRSLVCGIFFLETPTGVE
jgi:hypothetical protein